MRRRGRDHGQATVELVALLPLIAALLLAGWQAVAAGRTWWLAASAARAGARAAQVGGDPRAAARLAVPGAVRARVRVREQGARVTVRLPVLSVLGGRRLGTATVAAGVSRP
ncbi:unannotated protein [freshwater metagenome]|uniref:Unannotated protein n=1 Tax=freshwater metagenome TaxID=449393 RepID=A0A6J7D3G6_9ZZZZ|nr:pilus assembly protein [Actinomycetota bacterium]